jgi:glycosyltransferase involved in cell wall biosynthesis
VRLEPTAEPGPLSGLRVVIDARPLQEPERSPLTAWYLGQLLDAFAADPVDGESFVVVSRSLRPDPAAGLAAAGLPVAASRRIPPTTRALRSAGLTLDSFLLRGAELGTRGTGVDEQIVFHTAGGAVPLASRLPVVATVLDMAPWDLPSVYAATAAARLGHRVRARVLRDAARVIVCSRATGEAVHRTLHVPAERIAVIPLAVGSDFAAAAQDRDRLAHDRQRLGLPPRYFVFAGRYDARKDLRTMFEALKVVSDRAKAPAQPRAADSPALVVALDVAFPEEHARVARAVDRFGLRDSVTVVAMTSVRQRAAVIAGAQAFVYPAVSESAPLPVIEALSLGVPVICSRAGALAETVGSAGIVVEPRDVSRMAAALESIWSTGSLSQQLRRQAERRAGSAQRTWSDVARETRIAYSAAASLSARSQHRNGAIRSAIDRIALR